MNKILVANRGEIALRIMKTARRMGIRTAAIYSEADRAAPHVRFADESYLIGPPPSERSYLRGEKIIEAAKELGADAVHPGYGFLSENASFARAVENNGLVFIGPGPSSIEIMGSKLAAKAAVKAYQIPMAPGIDHAVKDIKKAQQVASRIGYPVLIKAVAGGGGKGMRIVERAEDLAGQMERAISEATSAFGDGSVFIEKYIASPRHIEIQILADSQGHFVHLFERECSIQRRHQKVIEEAPSTALTPAVREAMGRDAVKVAQACRYLGAGTVEFLVDDQLHYYFLEMNTRLQVEHPVTEMVTGLDLVEQQIRIARGEALSFRQEDLQIKGHALELRVYAEDPKNDFLPSIGQLTRYKKPEGSGIRVDDGYEEGMNIPIYYDPMIAKLITWASSRSEAISLMLKAISEYRIKGVATTLPFGKFVCRHPAFLSGDFDTHFVQKYFHTHTSAADKKEEALIAAQVALKVFLEEYNRLKVPHAGGTGWRGR